MTWDSNSDTRHVPHRLQQRCFKRDHHTCQQCGYIGGGPHTLFADHILNRQSGGSDTLDNLQTLCRDCHSAKTRDEIAVGQTRRRNSLRLPAESHPGNRAGQRKADPWE